MHVISLRSFAMGLLLAWGQSAMASEDAGLRPLNDEQIQKYRLRESDTPSRDLPGYRPLRRVLVTLGRHPGLQESLQSVAPGVEFVVIPGATAPSYPPGTYDAIAAFSMAAEALDQIGPVAWVHSYSAGIDALVVKPAVRDHRPIVTNSRGTTAAAIAEHALGMMMAQARQLHHFRDLQADSRWGSSGLTTIQAEPWRVAGKTLLVLGLGAIGNEIAQRAHALGMTVTATRNSSREGPDYVSYVGLADETLKLAGEADVVVNALPLTDSTRGLANAEFFENMKSSAIYLSVGRGPTTVTDDLLQALREGKIAGAGIDVTDPEPLPPDHPLWQEPAVIITPHVAYAGGDPLIRYGLLLENLRRYQAGEPLLNVADIDAGY